MNFLSSSISVDSAVSFMPVSVLVLIWLLWFIQNRNATCGKHKEEILRQIRLLERSETCLNFENADVFEPVGDLQFQDAEPTAVPEKNCASFKDQWESLAVPDHEVGLLWLFHNCKQLVLSAALYVCNMTL